MSKNKYNSTKDTVAHINQVRAFLHLMIRELLARSLGHDQSKIEEPELSIFDEFTPKLKECTYGSEEYNAFLAEMGTALKHHYARNRHHPEHFANGINDMNLIDLIEMLCDWKAATLRHDNGNIRKSLEMNTKRFEIDTQLRTILENTIELFR